MANDLITQAERQHAVVEKPQPIDIASQIVAMAANPDVDVAKLERLMQMHERAQARIAEESFNAAMSTAQKAMRPIAADATNPSTRSKYASYAALDSALRPLYTDNGFGLSFDTGDSPLPEHIRVVCFVTQLAGHSRTYHIDMPADGKGAKGGDVMTKTHAVGSAVTYGMRYLLKMIFNVAVGEDDDDGNRAGQPKKDQPAAPAGFDKWWHDIQAVADEGHSALKAAFEKSPYEFRSFLTKHTLGAWEQLKVKAAGITAKAKNGGLK